MELAFPAGKRPPGLLAPRRGEGGDHLADCCLHGEGGPAVGEIVPLAPVAVCNRDREDGLPHEGG